MNATALAKRAPETLEVARLSCAWLPPEGGRPTLVLLHGWVMNNTTWFKTALPLADEGYGLLFPDLPGHGQSPALDFKETPNHRVYDRMAEEVFKVMDDLKIEDALVAGYSMGATVACAMARAQPSRVQGLLVLDPIVRFPPFQMLRSPIRLLLRFFKNIFGGWFKPRGGNLVRAWFGLHVAGMWMPGFLKRALLKLFDFTPKPSEDLDYQEITEGTDVQIFIDGFERTSWWVTAQTLEAKHRMSYLDVFKTFKAPIWIGTGVDDAFASVNFCEKDLSKGRHKVVPLPGDHLVICTAPEEVGSMLRGFVQETS